MPLAPATKTVAGNRRILRPAVPVDAACVSPTWFDYDLRGAALSGRKVIRTNLDASVIAVEARYGKREYQLAVRVLDEVPVAPSHYDTRVDRHDYYRDNCIAGVYLLLERTVYSTGDAEGLIAAYEALTTSADRLTLRIPARYQHVLTNAQSLFSNESDYSLRSKGERDIRKVAAEVGGSVVGALLVEALTEEDTELRVEFVGRPVDLQAVRDEAHGEAIEYVIAARARAAQDRYKIQQELPQLRDALDAALEADARAAQDFANTLRTLADAPDADVVERFNYGTDGSLYYARLDAEKSREAAQRLAQALQGLRWIEKDAERQTVLAGEDY
jgi:hypothetical protein